jgi:DtxR family Mn-dependent transcriptional regulator
VAAPTADELRQRRHLLAETLMASVLDGPAEGNGDCGVGRPIGESVVDSVCAYLGHPRHCPHGRSIPRGKCCRKVSRVLEPLVRPLPQLAPGDEARIVYIVPAHPEQLVRLSNLGVVPGSTIRLRQSRPAFVLRVGETTLALDSEIAREIYVKKLD